MGQRSISYINNPAPTSTQPHQMQCAIYSWNNRPAKHEMEQEISNSSILNQQDSVGVEEDNDTVRLWEEGWRERYYQNKFNVNKNDLEKFRLQVAQNYAQGLCWVLQYYYQGVPAWD
jgi:5'-3' exonuclease